MTDTVQTQIEALAALRLPNLQQRFAELVGEETRSPKKDLPAAAHPRGARGPRG